jgi:hypothetical protein
LLFGDRLMLREFVAGVLLIAEAGGTGRWVTSADRRRAHGPKR